MTANFNSAEQLRLVSLSNDSRAKPGKLLLHGAGETPVTFPLIGGEILVGRMHSVDLVLEDPAVSRIHAKIVRENGGYVVIDLESSTGTCVNGQPITRHLLRSSDVIEIASVRMEFRD